MQNRRQFIQKIAIAGGLFATGQFPYEALAKGIIKERLTILHTNDVHSRLDPFPMDGSKLQGLGGIAARATLIEQIRKTEKHVLLLDAGDIFQGTPYFNLYKGEPEMKAMSLLGYDAATMGNHDFDAGLEGFLAQLPHANFPFLTANYNFSRTVLAGKTQPYKVIKKGNIKIGLFGLGIQLHGLVPADAYGKTWYENPLVKAKEVSAFLKKKKGCHLVICLSHLGYKYDFNKISDCVLAKESEYIDVIIGGHTHTFLDEPTIIKNSIGNDVIVNQAGWGGVRLGKIDVEFDNNLTPKLANGTTVFLVKQTIA